MSKQDFWTWFNNFAAPKLSESKVFPRERTFRKMFEHLDSLNRPVYIVETGCVEDPDNWVGNGCSTILFDRYARENEGTSVRSYEIVPEKVSAARKLCQNVWFYQDDSVEGLKELAEIGVEIDLLYLDASHHSWIREAPSQVHHFNELMAIMPSLHEDTLVVVDDSVISIDEYPSSKVVGKGGLVAQYALEVGADFQFCDYQVGFTNITGSPPDDIEDIESLIERARAHDHARNRIAADRLYRLVLMATPAPWTGRARIARGEACANFARNSNQIKKFGMAIDWYRTALEVDPRGTDYRLEMIRNLVALGAMNVARRETLIATEIEPDHPAVWATLGGVESDMLNAEATVAAYDRQIAAVLKSCPDDAVALSDAYLNRATIALDTEDYDTVEVLCQMMRDLKVRTGDAHHMLAMLAYRQSDHEASIELFDAAIANGARNQPIVRWNKSLPLHSIGRYREGWIEHHAGGTTETTVQAIYIPHHRFQRPQWEGQPAKLADGQKAIIHVHTEAGHGDNIAMLRYLPMLVERGFVVRYECDPSLVDLVRYSMPQIEVVPRAVDYPGALGIKPFDYHIPIGDLPYAFGTDIDTVPWNGPYLKADPEEIAVSREKLKLAGAKGRKIGLCWSSGIRRNMNIWMERYGTKKSMNFADLRPIIDRLGDDQLVSLQVGDGRGELAHWSGPRPDALGGVLKNLPIDTLSASPDWAETAGLIANLDLVITVDTGLAHLAGAMGKPVWVMVMKNATSWHFMCYREGSKWNEANPWYPSARVFRKPSFTDPSWAPVVERIAEELGADVEKRASR